MANLIADAMVEIAKHVDTVEFLGFNDDDSAGSVIWYDRNVRGPYEIVEISHAGQFREEGQTTWFSTFEGLLEAANERAAEQAYERMYA